ncbi:TonB-dependent receptor [Acetobacter nitrogenifigens]|uniref:Membrane protein n=1 Tax=Acetobacter nitrogenifigens DSM 23921 = NBRC 105050 TaxID=1120919 RepID=A0A511X9H0_9PROT|nr:TonB-dependent receptor [Acetobacter nitrogenifigens]GEN59596.1 membrane protein [Acetobacter nitrogenifigens DSM 23921 = NBRC 105050]
MLSKLYRRTETRWGLFAVCLGCPAVAFAQTATTTTTSPVYAQDSEDITVIGTSPLPGSSIDRNRLPARTSVLTQNSLSSEGTPDLLHALDTQLAGVSLNYASGSPYQPTVMMNGFEASPLQGVAQGVAVYMDGIRFNQAFGDTVNWDLIPDMAISRVAVEGSNPVFGLNALGGALNINMKNGFNTRAGGEADMSGGSFGKIQAEGEYAGRRGNTAFYVAAREVHEDGWRDLQSSDIQSLYADLGWKDERTEIHGNLDLANSVLNGPGTSPIQLLRADPKAQFTAPNLMANKFIQFGLNGRHEFSQHLSIQGQAFYSYFQQRVLNGNAANDTPCDDSENAGLLCSDDDTPSRTVGGGTIPDFLNGGMYSEMDQQTTNTNSYGASLQETFTHNIFGFKNHEVAGVSYNGAQTMFSATSLIGGLTPYTRVYYGPGVVIDEPGDNVPVRVSVSDTYVGAFVADTIDITPRLSLTGSARYNFAEINLHDQNGGDLSGNHAYGRVNPAAGLSYRLTDWANIYGGYSEANRAPTPAELSCAGPENSCSLANFFVGDPDLKQVVARTYEAGLRGRFLLNKKHNSLSYDLGLFRTDADNDIVFINSETLNRAYFANIGGTRRQGAKVHLSLQLSRWSAYLNYTYTKATYRSSFTEDAGSNPAADADGDVTVRRGNRLPGIPSSKLTGGVDMRITSIWTAGFDFDLQSGQYLYGDEANLNSKLPGFFVLNFHTAVQVLPHLQVFGSIANLTNRRYYTYGTFSPTSSVYLAQAPNATNPRSYSPSAPIGGFGGIRVTF